MDALPFGEEYRMTVTADIEQSYAIYLALYWSHRRCPDIFTIRRCTVILTEAMGGRDWSWRVVGITHKALSLLKDAEYKKSKGVKITRAHIKPRHETTKRLICAEEPASLDEFLDIWKKMIRPSYVLLDRTKKTSRSTFDLRTIADCFRAFRLAGGTGQMK
jgi:hypothetical protein